MWELTEKVIGELDMTHRGVSRRRSGRIATLDNYIVKKHHQKTEEVLTVTVLPPIVEYLMKHQYKTGYYVTTN